MDTLVPPLECDVYVENHGSIFLFRPVSRGGRDWIGENVQDDCQQWFGGALVVEHRYAFDIADGMFDAGLKLR